jgi:hypothetical protein
VHAVRSFPMPSGWSGIAHGLPRNDRQPRAWLELAEQKQAKLAANDGSMDICRNVELDGLIAQLFRSYIPFNEEGRRLR